MMSVMEQNTPDIFFILNIYLKKILPIFENRELSPKVFFHNYLGISMFKNSNYFLNSEISDLFNHILVVDSNMEISGYLLLLEILLISHQELFPGSYYLNTKESVPWYVWYVSYKAVGYMC